MKTKKLSIIFLVCLGLGLVTFKGAKIIGQNVINNFNSGSDKVDKIQLILEENCDCQDIEIGIYAQGFQYGKVDGFTTEKVDFKLTNCNYDNLKEESETIAKVLNEQGLETFNLVTLEFVSAEKQETVIIKNGTIQ